MNDIASPPGWPLNRPVIAPTAPMEKALADVAALIANVGVWDKACPVINDEVAAAACNDFLGQLERKHKYYNALRAAEKKPHDDAGDAVQAKWKPPLSKLLLCKQNIKPRHDAWLARLEREQAEERRRREQAAAEAERRAEQLTRQAGQPGPGTLPNMIAAADAAAEAAAARKAVAAVPERAQTRGTLGGRTRSLHKTWHAQVLDFDLFYMHVRGRREVQELLSMLANQAARSKDGPRPPDGQDDGLNDALPGCLIFSEES